MKKFTTKTISVITVLMMILVSTVSFAVNKPYSHNNAETGMELSLTEPYTETTSLPKEKKSFEKRTVQERTTLKERMTQKLVEKMIKKVNKKIEKAESTSKAKATQTDYKRIGLILTIVGLVVLILGIIAYPLYVVGAILLTIGLILFLLALLDLI
jgi:Flp pilus assembly protein TadB